MICKDPQFSSDLSSPEYVRANVGASVSSKSPRPSKSQSESPPKSKTTLEDSEWDWACKMVDEGLSAGQAMSRVDVTGLSEREKRVKLTRLLGKYLRAKKSKTSYAQEIEKVRSMKEWELPLEAGIPEAERRVAALMKVISEERNGKGFPFPVRVLAQLFPDCPTTAVEAWDIIQRLIEYGCITITRKGSAHGEGKGKASHYKWQENKNGKSDDEGGCGFIL